MSMPLCKSNSPFSFASINVCSAWPLVAANNCSSSSESAPRTKPIGETAELGNHGHSLRGEVFLLFLYVNILIIWIKIANGYSF